MNSSVRWLQGKKVQNNLFELIFQHASVLTGMLYFLFRLDRDLLGAGNQNLVKIIAVLLEVSHSPA